MPRTCPFFPISGIRSLSTGTTRTFSQFRAQPRKVPFRGVPGRSGPVPGPVRTGSRDRVPGPGPGPGLGRVWRTGIGSYPGKVVPGWCPEHRSGTRSGDVPEPASGTPSGHPPGRVSGGGSGGLVRGRPRDLVPGMPEPGCQGGSNSRSRNRPRNRPRKVLRNPLPGGGSGGTFRGRNSTLFEVEISSIRNTFCEIT